MKCALHGVVLGQVLVGVGVCVHVCTLRQE